MPRQTFLPWGLAAACFLAGISTSAPCRAYKIRNRWTSTQTDGVGNARGTALTLLWSVVPDGASYSRSARSDVVGYLDDAWSVAAASRTADLTNRPWWQLMDRVYEQFERVSGLTLTYVAERNSDGSSSQRSGDIRIGGETIDNDVAGVLADSTFPNGGDMRLDTSRDANGNPSWWHSAAAQAQFRNLIAHESGHGMGLDHDTLTGAKTVMATPLQSSFWGLQFDDAYALNRLYGDPREKNGASDGADRPIELGAFAAGGTLSLGGSASSSVVWELDGDWLGIDGLSDEDWFRFTLSGSVSADIAVTPLGPSYVSSNAEVGQFVGTHQSDLHFQLFSADAVTQLATRDALGLGGAESLEGFSLQPGAYYLRVAGKHDLNQFYALDLEFVSLTPPGPLLGDLIADGVLNQLDIDAFLAAWRRDTSALSDAAKLLAGDLDLNGVINLDDWGVMRHSFAQTGVRLRGFAVVVPEPSAAVALALLVGGGAAVRSSRRAGARDAARRAG